MILTCPSCTMRYIVSEGAIGPKGRTVRCAHCGHQWHEDGEEGLDAALFDDDLPSRRQYDESFGQSSEPEPEEQDFQAILRKEMEASPIPEGVRPTPEEYDPVLAQLGPQKAKDTKPPSGSKFSGFVTAALVWVFIFAGLLFLQPQISRAFPPSNMLYGLVGLQPVMPGDGLALDGLHAAITEGKILLRGNVINLRDKDVKVPAIMASIVDRDEKVIDQLLIPPPVARIKPEGQVAFDVVYPKIPDGAANATFAFSFMKVEPAEAAPSPESEHTEEAPASPENHETQPEQHH